LVADGALPPSMRTPRRVFVVLLLAYGLGWLGITWWPAFRESFAGMIVAIPPFSIYLFEHWGVPGLTDRNDCDWMWCKPTIFGTIVTAAVWLGLAWCASLGVARLLRRSSASGRDTIEGEDR
jgi:hypothetical protein